MAIKKIPSTGHWQVDFRDRTRRRHRATFETKNEAQVYLDERRREVRKGLFIDAKRSPTMREAGWEWLGSREDREAATYEFYRRHLERHILPRIGDMKICDVDVRTIEREIRDPLVRAGKLPTANKVLTTLTSFWKWAANRQYVSPEVRSPAELAERVRVPRDKRSRGPERVYTAEEIGKLIALADSLKYMVAFALLGLGLRRQEVLALTWGDVTPDWTALHVQRAVTHALGPRETKRMPKMKGTKSDAGDRWLPLSAPLAMLLKKWRLQCQPTELGLILPNTTGGVLSPRTLYDALKRAQVAAGVRPLDVKAFRHTFATALIEGGETDGHVADLMGHADTTVTRRVYAHSFKRPEGSKVAADFAAAIFRKVDSIS